MLRRRRRDARDHAVVLSHAGSDQAHLGRLDPRLTMCRLLHCSQGDRLAWEHMVQSSAASGSQKLGTAHETAHEVRAYSPDPTDCHIDACTDVCGCSQRARPPVDTSIISSTTRASPPSSTCTARQCHRHAAAPSAAGANRRDVRHASRSASSGRARTLQLALNCGSGLCSERCCGAAVVARLSWRVTTC